ncbi:MAG: DUF937 domain-containing protein [Planctomycetales bacterium]|nr:DUF937 domain-containing protein [Planctomycetales bacterium]
MSVLMDLVAQRLDSQQIDQWAQQLGATRQQTESALGIALPTLVGAVSRRAEDTQSVQELHQALATHDGSILEQREALSRGESAAVTGFPPLDGGQPGTLLDAMLGGRQSRVEQGIGRAAGLSSAQIRKLLALLAPLVMGAIGKRARLGKLDSRGLAELLRGERAALENQASGGLLAGLLDLDGDGDFDFQDMMKLGKKRWLGR